MNISSHFSRSGINASILKVYGQIRSLVTLFLSIYLSIYLYIYLSLSFFLSSLQLTSFMPLCLNLFLYSSLSFRSIFEHNVSHFCLYFYDLKRFLFWGEIRVLQPTSSKWPTILKGCITYIYRTKCDSVAMVMQLTWILFKMLWSFEQRDCGLWHRIYGQGLDRRRFRTQMYSSICECICSNNFGTSGQVYG
jgi:hypothetical protein